MVAITVQNYTDAEFHTIIVGNKELFWVEIVDVQKGLGIQNISDLVRKEICGIFETKNITRKQIRKYKSSQKEIDRESNFSFKSKYARNDLMEKITKTYRGVKKCNDVVIRIENEKQRENVRATLVFKEHAIMLTKEYSTKLKIKKMFPNEMIEEQYKVLGYFIDSAFLVLKLSLEVDENGYIDSSEPEEKEIQKAIEKETGFTIIRINPEKEDFDINEEIARIINHIIESTKHLAEELAKKPIIDNVEKNIKSRI